MEHNVINSNVLQKAETLPRIAERSDQLADAIERLDNSIDTLCRRLSPVLAPDYKEGSTSPTQDSPVQSDFARTLEIYTDRLRGLNFKINDALDRLEL